MYTFFQCSFNDQFKQMANPDVGTIKSRQVSSNHKSNHANRCSFIISIQTNTDGKKVTVLYDSMSDVLMRPDDPTLPKYQTINCISYYPKIDIKESGTTTYLKMNFTEGTAYLIDPDTYEMIAHDMEGWYFEGPVNLNFNAIATTDIQNNQAITSVAQENLYNFTQQGFSIQSRFMDSTSRP